MSGMASDPHRERDALLSLIATGAVLMASPWVFLIPGHDSFLEGVLATVGFLFILFGAALFGVRRPAWRQRQGRSLDAALLRGPSHTE